MSIDLEFRPASYADFHDPVAASLNGIKGQMRREMARDMMTAEGERRAAYDAVLGPIEDEILDERASEAFVNSMNRSRGPSWMGGEYLPDLVNHEIEIARVVLASTTMDVFSVRARRIEGGYRYSMADEYGTSFQVTPEASEETLTLGELVHLIDTVESEIETNGSFVEAWWWQQREYGDDLEDCTAFAWVESEQYPRLAAYYQERARQWRADRIREGEEREARLALEIERIVKDWQDANPHGGGGAIGAAARNVRDRAVERFVRGYVAWTGELPTGVHVVEWQFCGRQFSRVDFDRLAEEAEASRLERPKRGRAHVTPAP